MSDTYLGRPRRVPEPKYFLSIDEVARCWGCTPEQVVAFIDEGALHAFKLTRSKRMWRIKRPDVEAGMPQYSRPTTDIDPAAPSLPASAAPRGAVYFVQCLATGLIKIGFSVKPRSRIMGLQTGSAGALQLRALVPGPPSFEYEMHREFDAERERGEWFQPSPDLLAFIKKMRKQHPLPAWAKEIGS